MTTTLQAPAPLSTRSSPAHRDAPQLPQTVVITAHPTSALSQNFNSDFMEKIARNKQGRYDTVDAVRQKAARYVDKRLQFLERIRTRELSFEQATFPAGTGLSPKAIERLRREYDSGTYTTPPTVHQEAARTQRYVSHIIDGVHDLARAGHDTVLAASTQFKAWASRDNDRSAVAFGDQSQMLALQVQTSTRTYERLLDRHADEPFFPVQSIRRHLQASDEIAVQLQEIVQAHRHDRPALREALRRFCGDPAHNLQRHENAIRELCAAHPGHPFSTTFELCRLSALGGEVRVNGSALGNTDPASADAVRTGEIFDEIALLDACYPDTRSVVIADFSHVDQIDAVQTHLAARGLRVAVVPLVESREDVEYLLDNADEFIRRGIKTLMQAGSDLVRAEGTVMACILRWLFNRLCAEHGFNAYIGNGTSARRSGGGVDPGSEMARHVRTHLHHPSPGAANRQSTLQGGQASINLGNPVLAAGLLLENAGVPPQDPSPTQAHADTARRIFQRLTELEMEMRQPGSAFGDFFRRNPVIQLLRNLSTFHGSRDVLKTLQHLFGDRAISADMLQQFFLLAAWPWNDLGPQHPQMQSMIRETQQALREGNPLVRDIVLNLALQAAPLQFGDLCQAKWRAAGFSEDDISRLEAGRRNMLHFLAQAGCDLATHTPLQRHVMEYLGIARDFDAGNAPGNLRHIQQRYRQVNQAGIAALEAMASCNDPALPEDARKLARLEQHLRLTQAFVLDAGVKS